MRQQTIELLDENYEDAQSLYSLSSVKFIGQLALGLEACNLPIDLNELYEIVDEGLCRNSTSADNWASTFGALSINARLISGPTQFNIVDAKSYRPKDMAEIATRPIYRLSNVLASANNDSCVSYLLAENDEPMSVEMALVQALHMVDTAIVTGQYSSKPLIRFIDIEELMELKAEYPEIFIRQYGNVRGLSNVPRVLGSVVSVDLLESSNITTRALNYPQPKVDDTSRAALPVEFSAARNTAKNQAAFVGVTTAKLPHLGHGFLIAKAFSEGLPVVVELNDHGPRVELAIAKLASQRGISIKEAVSLINQGDVGILELQSAYRSRDEVQENAQVPDFKLTAANNYYRNLIKSIAPPNLSLTSIANSELGSYIDQLRQNTAYRSLFGEGGMGIVLGQDEPAVVVEAQGKLSAVGILAALATKQKLTLVDSPPMINSRDRRVLYDSGLQMDQGSGTGIIIDGQISSGTNGGTILLESLVDQMEAMNISSKLLLPALRLMMDTAGHLPGEEGSMCPNYASTEAAILAFEKAVSQVQSMEDPFQILTRPINYKNVLRPLLGRIVNDVYEQVPPKGKITSLEVSLLVKKFPLLSTRLSSGLLNYALSSESNTIPKNLLSVNDRATLTMFRTCSVNQLGLFLADQMEDDQTFANQILCNSELGTTLESMGYNVQSSASILRKISNLKGLYRNEPS